MQQNKESRPESAPRLRLPNSPGEPALDRLTALAARVLQVPYAFIAVCEGDGIRLRSVFGEAAESLARHEAFASYLACSPRLRVAEDASADPCGADPPLISQAFALRFYAAAPLKTEAGTVIGTLCVMDSQPRSLDESQRATLADLADLARREAERAAPGLAPSGPAPSALPAADSESRYRMLTEMMSDFAYLYGRDATGNLRLEWISDAVLQATGYSHDELMERGLRLLMHPDDLPQALTNAERLMEGRSVYSLARIITKSGAVRWMRGYGRPRYDAEGRVVGFYGASLDVTEQKLAEQRLEESQQRYRSLFEYNTDAVYSFDREGVFTSANPACERLTGYAAAELYEMSFLPLVVPEHREQSLAAFQASLRGAPQAYELAIRRSDGQQVDLSLTKVPVVVDGKVIGICGTAKDITAQKRAEHALRESEERFRAIAASLPVSITITGRADGAFLYVNSQFRQDFGLAETDSLEALRAADLYVGPEDRALLLQRLAADGNCGFDDLPLRRPNGSLLWVSGSCRAATLGREEVIVCAYSNNTERREWTAERERLLAEALARADQDPLTGLINHRLFHKRLHEAAAQCEAAGAPVSVLLLDVNNFTFFNDLYGHWVGDDALREVARALEAESRTLGIAALARFGGDEFAVLLPQKNAAEAQAAAQALVAAVAQLSYHPPGAAAAIPFVLSWGAASLPDDGGRPLDALSQAEARLRLAQSGGELDEYVERLRGQLGRDKDGFTMLDSLVTAVDNKDRYTRRHSEDVLTYSLEIARALGLDADAQQSIPLAALLHDVGKIGVPDRILRKPGALTDDEMEIMKLHPMMGAVIVGAVPGFEGTLEAVRHHHERWDGRGYPFGLAGEQIPLLARIMAVADAFSAMTINRPYRKGMTPQVALSRLREGAGLQWDPVCVAAFLQASALQTDTLQADTPAPL